jgi:hypothetical protein
MSGYAPMTAILVHAPFSDPAWLFERKFAAAAADADP